MAKVKNNIVTQGLSGTLGGQLVFRQTSRGTVVSVAPQAPSGPPTAGQVAQRTRFQQAVVYAKGQSHDPVVQAEYADEAQAQDISVYNVLLRDFMQAPNIGEVDLSQYTGKVGDPIAITATDDHAVKTNQAPAGRPTPVHGPPRWGFISLVPLLATDGPPRRGCSATWVK